MTGITADVATPFDHGAVSRFNAWFFDTFDRYVNHILRHHKAAAFDGIQAGDVVELGAGVGANLRHLPDGSRLVAVEPSLRMHDRLRRRAQAAGVDLTVVASGAEAIPVPTGSVDEVICSLVLCTVADPDAVLSEVRRILRPGGRFRFVEHVAAHPRSPRRWLQRTIRRPWAWLFEGCQLDRHTAQLIHDAGFSDVQLERRKPSGSAFIPINTAIWGIATR